MFKKRNFIILAILLLLLLTSGREAYGQPSIEVSAGIVFDADAKLYPVDLSFGVAYSF